MTLDIALETGDGVLAYRLQGTTTREAMCALADRIRADSAQTGITRVLLDCAGMSGVLPLSELQRVGQYFGEQLAAIPLAAIHAPAAWKANHFSEDVVGARGGVLRHFASRQSALRWLAGL